MEHLIIHWCLVCFLLLLSTASSVSGSASGDEYRGGAGLDGTIAVSSVGRPRFCFDIFYLPPNLSSIPSHPELGAETRLTDGKSVNYNGQFVGDSEKQIILELWAKKEKEINLGAKSIFLAYVSERGGLGQVYFDILDWEDDQSRRQRRTVALLDTHEPAYAFQDRPTVAGGRVIYVGMRNRLSSIGRSWTAVYSRNVSTGETRILTPEDAADFSPAVSPSGEWVIVASDQCRGFHGELCNLNSDLYILKAADGSNRRLLLKDGGWPSWASDSRFFFHRRADDGWWSIYEAHLPQHSADPILGAKRITKGGFHAFTPAASRTGEWLAAATRRPGSKHRHIEILNLTSGEWYELTKPSVNASHYNPFVSPDSAQVGYHRCRCAENASFEDWSRDARDEGAHNLERLKSVVGLPKISLVRIDGDFPSFSPDGSVIAFNSDLNSGRKDVSIMPLDGSWREEVFNASKFVKNPHSSEGCLHLGKPFGTAWSIMEEDKWILYSSIGENIFMTMDATVHVIAIYCNATNLKKKAAGKKLKPGEEIYINYDVLTLPNTKNNAFPSPSPDGKKLVFRSSRSGYSNLYIMEIGMDAVNKKVVNKNVYQLTNGSWTDTMCTWSPDGKWIAFTSNRDNPGSLSFAIYVIRFNGSEHEPAKKVLDDAVHPQFSPDSQSLLFTTNYGGLSAEPISTPNQFQPYGEIYLSDLTGQQVQRLTFSPYETGVAAWGKLRAENLSSAGEADNNCKFSDSMWLEGGTKEAEFCLPSKILEKRHPKSNCTTDGPEEQECQARTLTIQQVLSESQPLKEKQSCWAQQ
ncbi:hypothetical protein O6H91_03G069700 [Diphasiastrum complanatum]|nr:hypothetical protein O6H91_03G069700 [Diphasiastrum complanatum]